MAEEVANNISLFIGAFSATIDESSKGTPLMLLPQAYGH